MMTWSFENGEVSLDEMRYRYGRLEELDFKTILNGHPPPASGFLQAVTQRKVYLVGLDLCRS